MTRDGVTGTAKGDGLQQCFEQSGRGQGAYIDEAARYYRAARLYNSGSIESDGDLGHARGARSCYCSDLANRLIGWHHGLSECNFSS